MKNVNIEEILATCSLCPGICISSCPVYMTTRLRSASPNSIARIVLRYLRYKDVDPNVAFYCNYCKNCERLCPINNALPEALRLIRRELVGKAKPEIPEPTYLGGKGKKLIILSPKRPSNRAVKELSDRYETYWLDTGKVTYYYLNGLLEIDDMKEKLKPYTHILLEDLDLPVIGYDKVLDILEEVLGKDIKCEKYVLHIPCRIDPSISQRVKNIILGKPVMMINKCSGAYLSSEGVKISDLFFRELKSNIDENIPIITLCRRSQMLFSRKGMRSYTLLDLLEVREC